MFSHSTFIQNMKSSKPAPSVPRPLVRKLKVKTGCITCRIRKVKCDEDRPFCKRCRDTGRTCDGYAAPSAPPALTPATRHGPRRTSIVARPFQRALKPSYFLIADTMLSSTLDTPEERRFLDFFHQHTGRALSGAFDTGFWTHLLPQLSHSEGAIRHGLIAVGSLHAQYESANDSSQKDAILSHQFTLQQYNQAITSLRRRLSGGEELIEVTLMCCVLFICFECLRGNRDVALSHLHNGLNILSSVSTKRSDLRLVRCNNPFGSDFVQKNLRHIFSRLDAQLTLFGKPVSDIHPSSEPTVLPVTPHTFNNILEAKACMDNLITSSLQFVKSTLKNKYTGTPTASMQARQLEFLAKFQPWQLSFEALMENTEIHHSLNDQREALLLRIHHKATVIWLSTCLTPNETVFDAYIEDFESIISSVSALPKIGDTSFSFVLDMAIIAPLFLTAIKCRCSRIRHNAIKLLHAIPGREGLWDAKLHAAVAERIVAIEEAGLGEADNMPDESLRVYNADILSDIDVDPPRNYATFYTKPNGLDSDWVIWKEEIILP